MPALSVANSKIVVAVSIALLEGVGLNSLRNYTTLLISVTLSTIFAKSFAWGMMKSKVFWVLA